MTGTVGTIDTPDGRKQLTLNGWPLYYFAGPEGGDANGHGVNEVWSVLSPAGEPIRSAAGEATTSAAGVIGGGY